MTIKQLFKRYLKEKNYYGALIEFVKIYYRIDIAKCYKLLKSYGASDLFWLTCKMTQYYGINWYYHNKSLFEFIKDWCGFKCEIKRGDILTVKTIDGKYEFEYVVYDILLSTMEVEIHPYHFINLERVTKINGKECNYLNSWKFKGNTNNIHIP